MATAGRLVRAAVEVRGHLRYLSLLGPSQSRVAYVGWVGEGNLGDEAMLLAHKQLVPNARFVTLLPVSRMPPGLSGTIRRRRRVAAIMLGGGTLIGSTLMRKRFENLVANLGDPPAFMLGTGVEDPSFDGVHHRPSAGELALWKRLLTRFDQVRVRGPRSQEILEDMGVASVIVGDPALALADEAPSPQFVEGLLGLNIGVTRELWGGDSRLVLDWAARFGEQMLRRGWRIRLVPVWRNDWPYVQRLAARLGSGVEVVNRFLDLERVKAAIRECDVFVGQKLHSVVLASALYVPSVMLEYRPKCLDFQRSLGREEFTVRTDRLEASSVIDMVEEVAKRRAFHREKLFGRVSQMKAGLVEHAREIAGSLKSMAVE